MASAIFSSFTTMRRNYADLHIRRLDNKERRGVVDLPAATRTMCVAVQYMVANLQGNQPAW